jgi:hypothetical protein
MKRSRFVRCLLLAVFAAGLRAGENAAPVTPPTDDALAAVKRDYEVIQRTRSSLALQRLDLPDASLPSQPPPAVSATDLPASNLPLPRSGSTAKPAKSANWLLDAMTEKKSDPLDDLRAGQSASDAGSGNSLSLEGNLPGQPAKDANASVKSLDAADNPLTSFMSAWMTPRDLELLKVKNADTSGTGATGRTAADGSLHGDGLGTGRGPNAANAGLDAHINPYLANSAPGLTEGTKDLEAGPALGVPSYAPASSLPAIKGDFDPVKPRVPPADLLKPQDDSKYFPQLKHF